MKKFLKWAGIIILALIIIGIFLPKDEDQVSVQTSKENAKQEDTKSSKYQITDVKTENDGYSTFITGILKNNTDSDKSYVGIEFSVSDKNGNKLDNALDNISDLKAGKTWKFKAYVSSSEKDINIDLKNPKITGF